MSKSKRKGTVWETACSKYLKFETGQDVERRALQGANDRGDLSGLSFKGERITVECKSCNEYRIGEWMKELNRERINDGAKLGVLMVKRKGIGCADEASMSKQLVIMEAGTFAKLLRLGGE